ncbi:MAG: tetratricopeptide repeat protein [Candidatus Tantalella remota]|nr:tetratricopeptide repeat protein [Candidatus Tantalella remota]
MNDIRKKHIINIALLLLLTAALFMNTLQNSFVWDDHDLIARDTSVHDLKNIPAIFSVSYWKAPPSGASGEYRPVSTLTFAIDHALWGLSPAGYHATNLLMHAANVLLVYLLVLLLAGALGKDPLPKEKRSPLILLAFLSAVLFASHPVHVESIAWIKNRTDLLASFFFLSSFILFASSLRKKNTIKGSGFYVGGLLCFLFSLASKETAVTLPLILLLYVACFLPREDLVKNATRTAPFWIVAALFLAFKIFVLGMLVPNDDVGTGLPLYSHVLLVVKTIGYYLYLLAYPFTLNAERLISIPSSFGEPAVLLSSGTIILVLFALWSWRRYRLFFFSLSWVLLALLPFSNIIFLAGRPIAEQRLYIPSVGYCVLLGLCILKLGAAGTSKGSRKIFKSVSTFLAVGLFLSFSLTTVSRNKNWKNPLTLWADTVASSPGSARANYNLANTYRQSGDAESAVMFYKKAIELHETPAGLYARPLNGYPAYDNLANTYYDMRMFPESIEVLRRAVARYPDNARTRVNLGVAYAAIGAMKNAFGQYAKAIELDPENTSAYNNLGNAYRAGKDYNAAINAYKRSLTIDPAAADTYFNLGNAYYESNSFPAAAEAYKKTIELAPNDTAAYGNLSMTYKRLGMTDKRIQLLEDSVENNPRFAGAYFDLSVTYYRLKDYAKAVYYYDKAAGLGRSDPAYLRLLAPYRTEKSSDDKD